MLLLHQLDQNKIHIPFPSGRLSEISPVRVHSLIAALQSGSIDTLRSKKQPSKREQSDDYFRVVAVLNDRWRVIVCKDSIQWILQKRRRDTLKWDGESYCMTRQGLLRNIREKIQDEIGALAIAIIDDLPERI